jgi:hypothetical protein
MAYDGKRVGANPQHLASQFVVKKTKRPMRFIGRLKAEKGQPISGRVTVITSLSER